MTLLEALAHCRDTGARVRPTGSNLPALEIIRNPSGTSINLGNVAYWKFAELLGPWEIVPESVEQRKDGAP